MKKIIIRKQDVDEMIAYAKEKLPHEACGLLAGTEAGDERAGMSFSMCSLSDSAIGRPFTVSDKSPKQADEFCEPA